MPVRCMLKLAQTLCIKRGMPTTAVGLRPEAGLVHHQADDRTSLGGRDQGAVVTQAEIALKPDNLRSGHGGQW